MSHSVNVSKWNANQYFFSTMRYLPGTAIFGTLTSDTNVEEISKKKKKKKKTVTVRRYRSEKDLVLRNNFAFFALELDAKWANSDQYKLSALARWSSVWVEVTFLNRIYHGPRILFASIFFFSLNAFVCKYRCFTHAYIEKKNLICPIFCIHRDKRSDWKITNVKKI